MFLLNKRKFKRNIKLVKKYIHLTDNGAGGEAKTLKNHLSSIPLWQEKKTLSSSSIPEISVRQRVFEKQLNKDFNFHIINYLSNKKKISIGIPKIWRKELEKKGYEINNLISNLLWLKFIITQFVRSIYLIIIYLKAVFNGNKLVETGKKY